MPDVFVSYSHQDLEFVHKLTVSLKRHGKQPWFDQIKEPLVGIVAGVPWWKEIQYGIETADSFVFVISPNSISSPYCHAEICYARELGKRLIPLLYCSWIGEQKTRKTIDIAIEDISDDEEMPDSVTSSMRNLKNLVRANWLAISEIQYVVFAASIAFEESIANLLQALDIDLAWVRLHSQLVQAAKLWEASGFDSDFLWQANRLKPVYEMIKRYKPQLTPLLRDFIQPEAERLLAELMSIKTTHQRRSSIGERLSVIGDPREGTNVINGVPDIVWCEINIEGEIQIGSSASIHVKPFYVSKYLITNQQFEAFITPDNFESEEILRKLGPEVNSPYFQPKVLWSDFDPFLGTIENVMSPDERFPNFPRNYVTWYQAVVFSYWVHNLYIEHDLFARFKIAHKNSYPIHPSPTKHLDTKWIIRLPYEWEWQYIAQNGAEQRQYPWGEWDDYPRANTREASLNRRTTAVGMYPHGAAECGALDIGGNLWEWCNNDQYLGRDWRSSKARSLRGGAFDSDKGSSASKYHYNYLLPHLREENIGFRLVCARDP
ncbi:MAG: SUMF1/EgtB/PvdO family nonheme iron enzyme [Anaerolineae bacterium]|nr:SUMF1/EgtB/PvdO family nonheme iron enzyme [Anaerolineae bacterium]